MVIRFINIKVSNTTIIVIINMVQIMKIINFVFKVNHIILRYFHLFLKHHVLFNLYLHILIITKVNIKLEVNIKEPIKFIIIKHNTIVIVKVIIRNNFNYS